MILVDNPREAMRLVEKLQLLHHSVPIAIDCETTGLRPYQGDVIRGFSLAFYDLEADVPEGARLPIVSYYVPVGYPEGNLSEHDVKIVFNNVIALHPLYVFHHAKFDLRFLRQLPGAGIPDNIQLWDTKIVAWMMDENLSNSLDFQAQMFLGEPKSTYMRELLAEKGRAQLKAEGVKGRIADAAARERGWALITAAETAEYGAKDAELTLRLYEFQRDSMLFKFPTLYGPRLTPETVQREMEVQLTLLKVEDRGIMVDSGRVKELLDDAEIRAKEIEDYFIEHYGVNIDSTKQLGELLYDTLDLKVPGKTPGGKPSTAAANLEKLKDDKRHGHLIEKLLEHRRLRKAASTYLKPMLEYLADDDRIHPVFWQTGTVTGRFSCSEPNLQTIPRKDKLEGVRDVFIAPEGYELWEYDLNAAEMRVVAGMAGEQVLIDGLNNGTDMHSKLAERVFGPDFTDLQRRYAKNIGYGFFYGLSSPATAAKYIEGPGAGKLAAKILDELKAMYPNVVKLMRKSQREAEKHGVIRIHDQAWPGRARHFITESPKKPFPYTALNAKVQGGIGEFMKDVMVEAERTLATDGARIVLQVHDSLVIEVPEGKAQLVLNELNYIAQTINPFKLPMIFEGAPWEDHS